MLEGWKPKTKAEGENPIMDKADEQNKDNLTKGTSKETRKVQRRKTDLNQPS